MFGFVYTRRQMHSGLNQYMKMIHDLLIFQVESGASPYSSEHGLVVRSFVYLFQLIHERPECHFILKASFLEIYNEKVRNIHNIHYFLTAYLASGKQRPKKNHIPRSWHAFFVSFKSMHTLRLRILFIQVPYRQKAPKYVNGFINWRPTYNQMYTNFIQYQDLKQPFLFPNGLILYNL